jgi:DNA invertase Pin-like site-specific DNA recombinase
MPRPRVDTSGGERLSKDVIKEIIATKKKNPDLSYRAVAKMFGVTASTVYWLCENNLRDPLKILFDFLCKD